MSAAAHHDNQVAGGLKAALHNPNVPSETKDRIQDRLENEFGTSLASDQQEVTEEGEHVKDPQRVLAGLKGALKNPNVSEAKKDEIQHKLDDSTI